MSSESDLANSKDVTTLKLECNDIIPKYKSFEECMDQYYDILLLDDGNELFACKYEGCRSAQQQESGMIQHLRQHFGETFSQSININPSEKVYKNVENKNIECITLSDDESNEIKSKNNICETHSNPISRDKNVWQTFVGIGTEEGNQCFHCQFTKNCKFKTNLRTKIKLHMNKHFESKVSPKKKFRRDRNRLTLAQRAIKTRKTSKIRSKRSSKRIYHRSKPQPIKDKPVSPQSLASNLLQPLTSNSFDGLSYSLSQTLNSCALIDINFNYNNAILSLKGMASVKKVNQYIKCQFIKGIKYFCCYFSEKCKFKAKRSQQTANHVHCVHLGFYLKCVRPDCHKIFRTPNSWREHQKNHICKFGLYGDQSEVIGVCRNSFLLKYQEIVVEKNQKAYKCKWKGCQFLTLQRTVCKRHIHNRHACPYRKDEKWKEQFLKDMEFKSSMNNEQIPHITL